MVALLLLLWQLLLLLLLLEVPEAWGTQHLLLLLLLQRICQTGSKAEAAELSLFIVCYC
jgi:hypothetical protein